jgi:hypothetical protein
MTMTEDKRRDAATPRTVEDQVARMVGESEARHDPTVALSTRIPESLRKRLRLAALKHDLDVQDAVVDALKMWLAKHE